jgi:sec-independent protein translocase protein TatA
MFGLGHWELLMILVIVMIIFGDGKLPEIGSGMGKAIRSFKKGVSEVETEELGKIAVTDTQKENML